MRNLRLAVKREYFEQMQSGEKIYEYRANTPYWRNRLIHGDFDTITITLGYPKKGDTSREITTPYHGFEIETIKHKHFGDAEVMVFAIPVGHHPLNKQDA